MAEILNVWRDDEFVGYFERHGKNKIEFYYDPLAPSAPISLSIPRFGPHTKNAAKNLLDNMLPDNKQVRESWATHLGISTDPFDLLTYMGQDVAGALVLLPPDMDPRVSTEPVQPAYDDEIADRIMSLRRDSNAWLDVELIGKVRMSLAGAQGKFTMANVDDQWFWSTFQLPSTHIFKPAPTKLPEAHQVESGALSLAHSVGIDAPSAGVIEFLGQETYMVERFDRETLGSGVSKRLHIEDIAQSMGRDPDRKYGISAKQVIELLQKFTDEEQLYVFIRMLAFNIMIGNADAHGKNYSVRLEDKITLTPIYDSVPTRIWSNLESKLAMRISGAKYSQEVSIYHWVKLADVMNLDKEKVVSIVRDVASGIHEKWNHEFTVAGASPTVLNLLNAIISASTRNIIAK